MRIADITVEGIRRGTRWRLVDPDQLLKLGKGFRLEEVEIEEAEVFGEADYVAYSAIFVTDSGRAWPLIQIKEVGDLDYGGEYCEYRRGRWRQVGLTHRIRSRRTALSMWPIHCQMTLRSTRKE